MENEIIFKKLQNNGIFDSSFEKFNINNRIYFPQKGNIIIYAPNGTGKTSFINILSDNIPNSELNFVYNGKKLCKGENIFSIILDQNNRNIIQGKTKDFYLGENIKKEFELEEKLNNSRIQVINEIITILNTNSISNTKSPLLAVFKNQNEYKFIKNATNQKDKLKDMPNDKIITFIKSLETAQIPKHDKDKLTFYINDLQDTNSIIKLIKSIKFDELNKNENINQLEENNDAIDILNKYHKSKCIICDNLINRGELLTQKQNNKKNIENTLDDKTKAILNKVLSLNVGSDSFDIKNIIMKTLETGNEFILNKLNEEFDFYENIFKSKILLEIKNIENFKDFEQFENEYQDLIAKQPIIDDEDIEFIQQFIKDCMNKEFKIKRVEDKNYLQIQLEQQEVLNIDRKELPLSTGEQNFLSLFMELLRVKNSTNPIVVIDDPISSFDSIFKNKIIYSIAKVLENKQIILLTHNIDVIRLLKSQIGKSFNLYILNNTNGSDNNGFISVNHKELELLTDLSSLTNFFRTEVFAEIQNVNLFLYSIIPFLRGYAHIIGNENLYKQLTKLMHGYMNENIDIACIYKKLFGDNSLTLESLSVNVDNILSIELNGEILNTKNYPLLNKTLKHTLIYLYLRLLVEKTLVSLFQIDTVKHNMLGAIISEAFPNNKDFETRKKRIFLTSKKTLINEFNHFEGNLSIFQPAIDITDSALQKEKKDIKDFIENLNNEVRYGKIENGN